MDLAFSDEQEQLRDSVRRFLADKSPISEVRRLMETADGYDPDVWALMAGQLGLLGLTIPEQYGGAGSGPAELTVVLEEMGKSLLCAPYFSTVALAANAIMLAGDEDTKKELLPLIAAGDIIAALAIAEDDGQWHLGGVRLEARQTAAGDHVLTGQKNYVLDGHVADLIIVVARTGEGVGLFSVPGAAAGLHRTRLETLDMTRTQARLEFDETPARLIGDPKIAADAVTRTLDLAGIALAAEMVGGAQQCLDMSVSYSKTRYQFDRPIGSFQAIKHKCADMLMDIETARTAAYYAGWAAADDADELAAVASLAKAHCSEAFFHAAAENIQIHGGIGFTWEHDAHLYFKRATSSQLLLGDPAYHRELLVQRIGI